MKTAKKTPPKKINADKQLTSGGRSAPPCSPSSIVALVRRYNRWRKGDDTLEMENPKQIGDALDAICGIAKKLERQRDDARGLLREALAMAEAWEDYEGAPAADFVMRLRAAISPENDEVRHGAKDADLD
jgi:hypothetical protein